MRSEPERVPIRQALGLLVMSGISVQNLLDLKSLAENRSNFARANLFERVAGLWTDGAGDLAPEAQGVMDDILVNLAREVETDLKARIAHGLARQKCVPLNLVRALASDDIAVAKPLLEECSALSEEALIAICDTAGMAHRRAIARRPEVSERLAGAAASRKEVDVCAALLANRGARLNRALFKDMLAIAKNNEGLRSALLGRSDLPKDFAHQMFWWVTAGLRRTILEKFAVSADELDGVLAAALADATAGAPLARERAKMRSADVNGVNGLVARLKSDDLRGFVQGLGAMTGTAPETAAKLVNDPGGEALAVACRAIGADRSQFTAIFLQIDFKRFGRARPVAHVQAVSMIYDTVNEEKARAACAIWNVQAT